MPSNSLAVPEASETRISSTLSSSPETAVQFSGEVSSVVGNSKTRSYCGGVSGSGSGDMVGIMGFGGGLVRVLRILGRR